MELPDFVEMAVRPTALRFLIIGGYAVAAHGHSRTTFDVDFLVRQADRSAWMSRAGAAGLVHPIESQAFAQFSQANGGDGLDFMFTSDTTFEQMWERSEERSFGSAVARVPCLDHLLALKLHAIQHSPSIRTSKDAVDVEMLLRRNAIKLEDSHYEALFLKYGTRELHEAFVRILRHE